MLVNTSEIKEIIEKNGFELRRSIFSVLKELSVPALCNKLSRKKGVKREDTGFPVSEVFSLMIALPLFLMKSVDSLYKSTYKRAASMQKDTLYRLMNNERMPWRTLLLKVSGSFIKKTNPTRQPAENSAFIIDDTTLGKTGVKMEGVSQVFDHTTGSYVTGFKLLLLALFDGTSIIANDFSLHAEKSLPLKQRRKQYFKDRNFRSSGSKRKKELVAKKNESAIKMIKRAVKSGVYARYILFDRWFFSEKFISELLKVGNNKEIHMDIAGGVRRNIKFKWNGKSFTSAELQTIARCNGTAKRCRQWKNCRYFEFSVDYKSISGLKLFVCRYPGQREWRSFITTNSDLSFHEFMKIYSIRWSIEVCFKECKQHLGLGKCQSRDFDAQIASATRTFILYNLLSYFKRETAYTTIGGLFAEESENIRARNIAERLWKIILELFMKVVEEPADNMLKSNSPIRNNGFMGYVEEFFSSYFFKINFTGAQ